MSGWFFYNLRQSIDDEKPFNYAGLPPTGTIPPVYSTRTLTRQICPHCEWWAFNPTDNRRLLAAKSADVISVGHEQLLFEVDINAAIMRPIYWPVFGSATVSCVNWVFSSTQTPANPDWDRTFSLLQASWPSEGDYRIQLAQASADSSLLRAISKCIELEQQGQKLIVDVLFSADKSRVFLFAKSGFTLACRSTVDALLNSRSPLGACAEFRQFNWDTWKLAHALPDRASDDPFYEPVPVNRLVLAFHGTGQKLSANFSRLNFVWAIDKLRALVSEQASLMNCDRNYDGKKIRFLVLAVNWRTAIAYDADFLIEKIVVNTVHSLRQAFVGLLVDIPLYMSLDHRSDMLTAAASEANRLHKKVIAKHPTFAADGEVSVIGHSLGSLIVADILSHQPTLYTGQSEAPFHFNVQNLFLTGSPVGLFLVLRKNNLQPRSEWSCTPSQPTPPFGCLAVQNIYNLIHESDMLCALLNPTVNEQPVLPPAKLPTDHRMCASERLTAQLRKKLLSSRLLQPIVALQQWWHDQAPNTANCHAMSAETSLACEFNCESKNSMFPEARLESHPKMLQLNDNGQIDWTFSTSFGKFGSQYFKILTAHFEYWGNADVARFLAIECSRPRGVGFTVPEHRAPWLTKCLQASDRNNN